MKAWRRTVGKPLKSFHLEAMLWETMTSPPRTWAEGLQLAFSRLADRAQRGFPDPTGLGAQVDDTLTMADRQRAVTLLRQAAERAAGLSQSADPARAVAGILSWWLISPFQMRCALLHDVNMSKEKYPVN